MKNTGLRPLVLLSVVLLGPPAWGAFDAAKDQDLFNQAKILMFDQKWEEARAAFQRLIKEFPQSAFLPQAYFHTAYCLRLQKKYEEALLAYDQFLQKYPNEPYLAGEGRKAVVELAASLVERGKSAYKNRLTQALADPRKEVRYFAAIRSSSLKDPQLNSLSVPILKEIVSKEKEQEIVNYASIALLNIDHAALSRPQVQKQAKSQSKEAVPAVKMFHLRIFEGGENTPPKVELTFPASFAQLVINALDDSAKAELRKKGLDIDNVWESLNRMGPTNILTIRSGPNILKFWIQ